MPTVAVREPIPLLSPLLVNILFHGPVRLVPPGRPADLLVLMPGCDPSLLFPCRTLLLPDHLILPALPAAQVVSCGPSPRDTLTFSSLGGRRPVLSLQREIVTLAGTRLERQEFPVRDQGGIRLTLAWAGTLLLAGVPPEDLAALPCLMPAPPTF